MTNDVALNNPYTLGATGVVTLARTDRLSLGASFRPSAAALGAVSGFLYGAPGTMGDLTLLTDTLLRVDPFIAVIQGTHASDQGQYVIPNASQRDLAVPAKDASLFRRALVVVRVADSIEAGVASSATTDGAWLEIIPGTLAASNPALPSMAAYANYLLVGELTIPSTASAQPVTITKYAPRTGTRGGILPVIVDGANLPGHDGAAGAFTGQYRDHPTAGLQRWNAAIAAWENVLPGQWLDMVRNFSFAAPIPVTGTPQTVPGMTFSGLLVPPQRTLEVEFHCPRMGISTSGNAYFRLQINGGTRKGGTFSTNGASGFAVPLTLSESIYNGTAATVSATALVQWWAATGSGDGAADGTSGSPVTMRMRIS